MIDDDNNLPVRRYSDAEVRLLLERAASAQATAPVATRADGLTLAQLEEIAAEAHIDVARLRQAARELDTRAAPSVTLAARAAGAPFRMHAEHTLPFEIDATEFGTLVGSIGNFTGEAGKSNLVGRTFTWHTHAASGRRLEVRITAHRGRTHIWVEERYGEMAGALFGGVLGGMTGASFGIGAVLTSLVPAAAGAAALTVAAPVAVVAGTWAACRVGYRAYVRNRAVRVGALCEQLVHELTALHDVGSD